MKISRRFVKVTCLLGLCITLVHFLYPITQTVSERRNQQPRQNAVVDSEQSQLYRRRGKVVILYSNQRSGSTFVGEFFNNNPDAFYLFEPLFSYTPSCSYSYDERLRTLKNQCICDFRTVPNDYRRVHDLNGYNDRAGRCLSDNICFVNNHVSLLKKYVLLCRETKSASISDMPLKKVRDVTREFRRPRISATPFGCKLPLNTTLVSAICSAAPLVAYKVLRVCDLSRLESVYRELTGEGNQVYVIHLVRDPRAIANSALHTELTMPHIEYYTKTVCDRMSRNIKYVEEQAPAGARYSTRGIVQDERYIRVRHEDISIDPVGAARNIYKFIGLPFPPEVQDWIEESSIDPAARIASLKEDLREKILSLKEEADLRKRIRLLSNKQKNPYGTVRNSKNVIGKWRRMLSLETVNLVQSHCAETMQKLGYRMINSKEEMEDFQAKTW